MMKFEIKDTVKISIMAALSHYANEFPCLLCPFFSNWISVRSASLICFSMGPLGAVMVELTKPPPLKTYFGRNRGTGQFYRGAFGAGRLGLQME